MVCSVCTTLLALALYAVSIFHLFINFDGYAAGEINWNDIYCSNNRRQQRDHSAISMMTINKWRWQEPNNFHIWPIAKHKISLITWIISYFIYCIYYVLTKHVAKPQAYGQQVKGNAIENQNKTSQWVGGWRTKGWKLNINSIRFHSIQFDWIQFDFELCTFLLYPFLRIIAAFELKCTWMNTESFNGFCICSLIHSVQDL